MNQSDEDLQESIKSIEAAMRRYRHVIGWLATILGAGATLFMGVLGWVAIEVINSQRAMILQIDKNKDELVRLATRGDTFVSEVRDRVIALETRVTTAERNVIEQLRIDLDRKRRDKETRWSP